MRIYKWLFFFRKHILDIKTVHTLYTVTNWELKKIHSWILFLAHFSTNDRFRDGTTLCEIILFPKSFDTCVFPRSKMVSLQSSYHIWGIKYAGVLVRQVYRTIKFVPTKCVIVVPTSVYAHIAFMICSLIFWVILFAKLPANHNCKSSRKLKYLYFLCILNYKMEF